MAVISGNAQKTVSKIFEYQRFIKLNEQFILELEKEGGDATQLRNEIENLEQKILELKLQQGFRE